jgi:hypothetical protein
VSEPLPSPARWLAGAATRLWGDFQAEHGGGAATALLFAGYSSSGSVIAIALPGISAPHAARFVTFLTRHPASELSPVGEFTLDESRYIGTWVGLKLVAGPGAARLM